MTQESAIRESTPWATRYRVVFRACENARLPGYAGSALRGTFGWALRRLSCLTSMDVRVDCPLYRMCPYPEIFETPPPLTDDARVAREAVRPYVIEPPLGGARRVLQGDEFEFYVVLIGRAQRHADLVRKAFAQSAGDGADLDRFELTEFAIHDVPPIAPSPPEGERIQIEFLTPLRLITRGKILDAKSLDFPSFAQALTHRLQRLAAMHGAYPSGIDIDATLGLARRVRESERAFKWKNPVRRSNRQHRLIPLGGVIGTWNVTGEFGALWPLLHAGQWTHVGKETTFGLGQYRLLSEA